MPRISYTVIKIYSMMNKSKGRVSMIQMYKNERITSQTASGKRRLNIYKYSYVKISDLIKTRDEFLMVLNEINLVLHKIVTTFIQFI